MRVLTFIGARPQFVKSALLSAEFSRLDIEEIVVHSGQHYDFEMSEIFFRELSLPAPRHSLGVGSGSHGAQTGAMMRRLEPIVAAEAPDWLLVYGDTNTTLAGALVGAKLGVGVAHVEAGLRSFNRGMPEEINRIVTDHVADLLFAPDARAMKQLAAEGVRQGVHAVGDLMADLAAAVAAKLPKLPAVLERLGVTSGAYGLATIHRAGNTDDASKFDALVAGLRAVDMPIVFPVHPRTQALARSRTLGRNDNVIVVPPLSYHDTIALMSRARTIFTDSGGMQKEAYVLQVPCVTLREETEWLETLEDGWNVLAGCDPQKISAGALRFRPERHRRHYGDGNAAARIAAVLLNTRGVELCRERTGEVSSLKNRAVVEANFRVAGDKAPMGFA